MNQKSNSFLSFFAAYILLPIAIAKLLWSGAMYYLDKDALTVPKQDDFVYHYNINLANSIIGNKKKVAPKQTVKTHARIDDIKLKGTFASDESSFIVIEDKLGTTFLYLNEKYMGYTLVKVFDNRAILEKSGKKFDLVLEDTASKSSAQTVSSSTKNSSESSSSEEFVVGEPTNITRGELNSYVKNPNKIWKNIRIQEVRKDGQLNGFRVNYVKKGSFFQKAGLKSGDVIRSVDGKELTSLADVMKYYTNIDNMNGLMLSVKRGSEVLDLEFNVN